MPRPLIPCQLQNFRLESYVAYMMWYLVYIYCRFPFHGVANFTTINNLVTFYACLAFHFFFPFICSFATWAVACCAWASAAWAAAFLLLKRFISSSWKGKLKLVNVSVSRDKQTNLILILVWFSCLVKLLLFFLLVFLCRNELFAIISRLNYATSFSATNQH